MFPGGGRGVFGRRGGGGGGFGMPRRGGRGRNVGGIDPMVMLLFMRLAQQIQNLPGPKPAGTLGLMGLMGWLHFMGRSMLGHGFGLSEVCISAVEVVHYGDLRRMVLSSFFHGDDYHLYYNLSSLLTKGVALERRLGTPLMLAMTAALLVLSNVLYVALAMLVGDTHTCAVGFSGVLFALKVIVTYDLQDPDADTFVWGLRLPSKHAVWLEMLVIQLIMPHASLIGHVSGALAGFLFLGARRNLPDLVAFIPREPPRTYGQGTWGNANTDQGAQQQQQQQQQQQEQRQQAEQERAQQQRAPQQQSMPSAAEMRQRRVNRFQ